MEKEWWGGETLILHNCCHPSLNPDVTWHDITLCDTVMPPPQAAPPFDTLLQKHHELF